jgi:uncharacterized membrane protein YGL010W
MRSVDEWLADYGSSHRHPVNKILHWICVPPIVLSVLGFLVAIPLPDAVNARPPWLNVGTAVAVLALLYYARLSPALALGMLPIGVLAFLGIEALAQLAWPLWGSCLAIFVVAWIGQFIGHAIEGQRPSFFKDLQYLLIGPLWLLAFVYRAAGIPYSARRVEHQRV